ncbi:hypothetical protein SUGI_0468260 [Cryptomeria japonica]|nr:hypothetical protein SUGI_0468260 [Cryptomeria japonica]
MSAIFFVAKTFPSWIRHLPTNLAHRICVLVYRFLQLDYSQVTLEGQLFVGSMTTIEGVGDEVVYVAIFISTFAFLYRTYLWGVYTSCVASQLSNSTLEPEVDNILNKIERYNRIFGGGSVGFFQRLRDMPLLLRRLSRELMDPQRALPLVFRARVMLSFALVAVYIFSPVDILPEGILGIVGLLDDLLIVLIVFFHVATLYRSTLFYRHGGRGQ